MLSATFTRTGLLATAFAEVQGALLLIPRERS